MRPEERIRLRPSCINSQNQSPTMRRTKWKRLGSWTRRAFRYSSRTKVVSWYLCKYRRKVKTRRSCSRSRRTVRPRSLNRPRKGASHESSPRRNLYQQRPRRPKNEVGSHGSNPAPSFRQKATYQHRSLRPRAAKTADDKRVTWKMKNQRKAVSWYRHLNNLWKSTQMCSACWSKRHQKGRGAGKTLRKNRLWISIRTRKSHLD